MSNVKWTKEQQNAIEKKGSNILVAAAAGSGKTAVLVERIIRKIIDDKIDIDRILVVTFTNAAASEMRERILDAIYKKIEENPEDENLQRQVILLNKASISTIDSFCLDIIKNNFYEIDISANSRIADETEMLLLKQDVIEDIFEEKYIENNKDFLTLIDTYTKYNRDEELRDLILKIHKYMQSNPFPEDWLNKKIELLNTENKEEYKNFSNTPWGQIIIEKIEKTLENAILKLENMRIKMKRFPELDKYITIYQSDIVKYKNLKEKLNNWDELEEILLNLDFKPSWSADKKITNELKDEAYLLREKVKNDIKDIKELVCVNSEEANSNIMEMYHILNKLKELVIEFSKRFQEKKREKNIMDFNDMEHIALKILVSKNENGEIVPTEVAKRYSEKFEEIAIDEYQDSNLVQETILTSISRGNNVFMVGDVKQSIYKFRQARPQLFLEKYNKYKLEPKENEDRKIQLFKNFRSRKNILDFTNLVFENIMSQELGEIDYNQEEYLNLGANYLEIPNQDLNTEINIIDTQEEENTWKTEGENDEEQERVEDIVIEARYVAQRIKQLIESNYQVVTKEGTRNIEYKDIAILFRSVSGVGSIYEKEISELGIPVYCENSGQYLQSIEIETIMSLLRIINNPMQEIPLVTVMRSPIANFTDNELIEIRLKDRNVNFYEALLKSKENPKVNKFLELLKELKEDEQYMSLDEWIWNIYTKTGYMDYVSLMPNGGLRVSNLKMLFERAKQYETASFKGLFNFINFIDKIKLGSEDLTSAKLIGENENVVRIMTIHKSKGLEFPVVIVAGFGKQFNLRDLSGKILLDQDLGIAPQYINPELHIEFPTLAKKAFVIKAKDEAISEEMRILYVALTRAKEKLIIVGRQKDTNKSIQEKMKEIEAYTLFENNENKINSYLLSKYKTYLDWLELIYVKEGVENTKNIFSLNILKKEEVIKSKKEEKIEENIIEKMQEKVESVKEDEETKKKITQIMEWEYSHSAVIGIPTKTSVTKIKEQERIEEMQEVTKAINFETEEIKRQSITEMPKFLKNNEEIKITSAQKGTLMHLCIQKMNEKEEYDMQKINSLVFDLEQKELITKQEAQSINKNKLLQYTKSELWKKLKYAKEVQKEKPFYINIKANKIYNEVPEKENENVLVQGVIDLYFIDENDKLYLIDYKTDYVEEGKENELVEKYKKQLEIYKEALEQALNKKVDMMVIYSVYLNKMIEIK